MPIWYVETYTTRVSSGESQIKKNTLKVYERAASPLP